MSVATAYVPIELLSAPTRFTDPFARCRQLDVSRHTDSHLERETAEPLMPKAALREAWAAPSDRAEVAARFEVSALAAQWRLYNFGLAEKPA
jgi:hypothetical protein